jgi:hypothetical protein
MTLGWDVPTLWLVIAALCFLLGVYCLGREHGVKEVLESFGLQRRANWYDRSG